MKNGYMKNLVIFSLMGLLVISSCTASERYTVIEDAIKSATFERMDHMKHNSNDINLPVSKYTYRLIDVVNALNKVWGEKPSKAFANYLLGLWEHRLGSLPEDSLYELDHPKVRVEIAQLLGQANRLCLLNISLSDMRSYVLKQLDSDIKMSRSSALKALGMVGDVRDISILVKVVSEEKEGWAEEAVGSLDHMQHLEAVEAIRKLETSVKRESLKEFIKDALSSYGPGFKGFIKDCGQSAIGIKVLKD